MERVIRRSMLIAIDLAVLSAAWWIAFFLRFEGDLPVQMLKRALFLWPYVVGLQYLVLAFFGVPSFAWRYVGLRETKEILAASAVSTAVLLLLRMVAGATQSQFPYAQYLFTPFGIIVADFVFAFLGVTGARVARRVQTERAANLRRRTVSGPDTRTILFGAGQAGLLVAKEIETRPDLGIEPVGFIDDDKNKVGSTLHGLRVLGTTADFTAMCRLHRVKQALITIANLPGVEVRRIKDLCDAAEVPVKVIPGLYEIVGGQVNLSRIRNVTIEDLLRRDPVEMETGAMREAVRGRVVLVTGAGGSIGSELCRQICRLGPAKVVLVEQAENALFHIHRELLAAHPELAHAIVPCIADVCDCVRIETIFRRHRPEIIYHAAAHKHVPMMEENPGEAIKNNVFGTRTLADAAWAQGVSKFVMISTDKAVNPTSVMGATKRVAEIYTQSLASNSKTQFIAVRFGNVLGSAGSVVPIFQEQIARGGPLTITHPEMKRYFMTIPEACRLVMQAGAIGQGGEVFILDMGEPVKILDLAKDLVRLSGLRPEDVEIQFCGLRPGEKLFEELSVAEELAGKTQHPKIFTGRLRKYELLWVNAKLDELREMVDGGDGERLREMLQEIVPEYTRGEQVRVEKAVAPGEQRALPRVVEPAVAVAR